MKRYLIFILLIAASLAGYFVGARLPAPAPAPAPAPLSAIAKTSYVCPMHSHIVRDQPGTCPICGMDLVPMSQQGGEDARQIHVDTATQQKLGVRLAKAEVMALTRDIPTYGTVVADESGVYRVTPNVDGVLAKLHVTRAGQAIAKGDLIYELSSQDALNMQYEYIDTVRRGEPTLRLIAQQREQNRHMIAEAQDAAARAQAEHDARNSEEQFRSMLQPLERDQMRGSIRLKQIGFSDEMIQHLQQSKSALPIIPVRARNSCVVKEVMARPGMALMSSTEIFSCVDTRRVWLELALYADQLAWVRDGDSATVSPDEGEPLKVRLNGVNGLLDPATRTVRARIAIPADRVGRLGDLVNVTLHASPREVLSIPRSALIRTGHGNFVMRAMDHGHFMPVKVLTGIETDERVAIRDGLSAGDQVVVNSQFLLDAAASMADSAQRLEGRASK